jgi:5'-nucleotidase
LVNDDGIYSPGLSALCDAVWDLGDLLIVAPSEQQTSMGRSYPDIDNLGIIKKVKIKTNHGLVEGYSVCASPAFTVAYAIKEIALRKPSLCISGINYGENLGLTVTYSGTIGAAMQAIDFGIPSLAISRPVELENIKGDSYAPLNWEIAKRSISYWTKKVLTNGIPFGAPLLNINVPDRDIPADEYKFTRQGYSDLFVFTESSREDFSQPYRIPSRKLNYSTVFPKGTDLYEVCNNQVTSVTPMGCDLTYKGFCDNTENIEERFSECSRLY